MTARARRPRLRWILLGLVLLVVGLGLLALPLLKVPGEAQEAKADLTEAMGALQSGDLATARDSVASAREHADAAQDGAQGIGGDIWSRIPLLGTPVADARHLVQALDDGTAVAELGVDLYPAVAGRRATLFRDGQVDEDTLTRFVADAREAGTHLRSARDELDAISASTPVIGDTIAANRDAAAAQVVPVADAYDRLDPMLAELPALLGFEGRRSYLVALLNPAELRYSGGAALSFAPMTFDQGALEVGATVSPAQDPRFQRQFLWRKVVGNNFHRGRNRIANSTFAPSWSTSGAELVRAWQRGGGGEQDGVIAVDVVTLDRLLALSGDVTVPGFGRLSGGELVETLVGSYDDFYPDATAQDEYNDALVPVFQESLFGGGDYVAKGRVLGEAAAGRHFATYFRDPEVQEGFAAVGLSGDLADTPGDYLFVGSQNTNGSKVDYYQRRTLELDVDLAADGSATNRLDVTVDNATPPYVDPLGVDSRVGYFTRWAGMALAAFLPASAEVDAVAVQGEPVEVKVRGHYQHSFLAEPLTLEPGATGTLSVDYRVPDAASVADSGALVYRLAVDPQGTVNPAAVRVTLHLPDGFRPASLPEGWTQRGGTLSFRTDALQSSEEWEIALAATE